MKKELKFLLAGLIMIPTLLLAGCGGDENKCENGNVLDGKICITLPADFTKMPEEMLKQKYPMAQRPNEVWYIESEKGKVSLAFSQTSQAMRETQLEAFAQAMKNQMNAFSPKVTTATVNGKKTALLEIITPDNSNAGGPAIISMMQMSSVNDKLLITTFSVTEDIKDKYYQEGKTLLNTLSW
ncbi:Uncharacterised protein [Leminorella richardii]|uniref:Lipoprotein n=1 Tax=Leminorella richardii TaxID=158841 RepID=A0A2X4UYR2_9GAMM|nr:hypothetical protein [Leminorella richardii]SQI40958.1 Uncharacterised protein [Leminorella richardii]